MVMMRLLPIDPVTEPKFAPLFGHPPPFGNVDVAHDTTLPAARVVGIVVDLPDPL